MRISQVKPSQRKKGRILVILEDETILRMPEEVVLRFGLRPGLELEEETLSQVRRASERANTKAAAARMAGYRALSKEELRGKLMKKGASAEDAGEAADWLEEIGAIDDANYAAALARHYGDRGYGAGRVREELRRRGVDRSLWEDALQELPEPEEAIAAFLKRKGGDLSDPKEVKRLTDALLRRGFRWGDIRGALGRYMEESEEIWEE